METLRPNINLSFPGSMNHRFGSCFACRARITQNQGHPHQLMSQKNLLFGSALYIPWVLLCPSGCSPFRVLSGSLQGTQGT